MDVKVDKSNLIITIPLNKNPQPSSSGKTLVVASTGGFALTTAEHNGQQISVSVNATVKNTGKS